ncbi:amidohydrolase [Corynebacterium flavescens]|uniref:amidohydrolase n=1 Tax=Corynebacterium flavescens TaxID=28028 RepID=UPI003F8DD9FF
MYFDTVIRNVRLPQASSDTLHDIAVWEGKIATICKSGSISLHNSASSFDANGAFAVPGFNDVHAHSVWFGQTLLEIDLSKARTCMDVYTTLREGKATTDSEWIIASGYAPSILLDGPLKIGELDRIAEGRPLLIKHNSGHAITVNTEALDRAGISRDPVVQIPGGTVEADSQNRATGLLHENAMRPVQDLLQPEALSYIEKALGAASRAYASEGITSITDAGIAGGWIGHSPLELSAYQNALDHGLLLHRTQVMITFDCLHEVQHHAEDPDTFTLDAGLRTGLGNDRLQIGPTKIFTDGSVLGATAAMTDDYCHSSGNSGYFQRDPAAMKEQAVRAAASGWSLAMHALGDSAVELALETITEATTRYGRPTIPHRIEHGGVTTNDQVRRVAELGIALTPQPQFIREFGDHMSSLIGAERTELSYPAKRIIEAGGILSGSSDRPVADGNPLTVIQAFAERITESGSLYAPNERISIAQALNAYTVGSATATGWQKQKGRLERGYLADITLLEANPLDAPVEEVSKISVAATFRGGETIFQA